MNGEDRESILNGVPILTSGTMDEYLKYSTDIIMKYLNGKNRPQGMLKSHYNKTLFTKNDNCESYDDRKKQFKKENVKFKSKLKPEYAIDDNIDQRKIMFKKNENDDKIPERDVCLQPQNKIFDDDQCSACIVLKQLKDYENNSEMKNDKELKKLKKVIKGANHTKYCDKSTNDLEMNDIMLKRSESVKSFGTEKELASDQLLKWADETIEKVGYDKAFELIQLSYDEKLEKYSTNQEPEKKEIKPIQLNLNFLENPPKIRLKIDPNEYRNDFKNENLTEVQRKKKGTYSSSYYLPCGEETMIEEKKSTDGKVTVMEDLFALDDIWKDLEDSIAKDDLDTEGTDSDTSVDSISTVINLRNKKFKDVRQDLSKVNSWDGIMNDLHEKELAKKIAREVVTSIEEELDTIIDGMEIQ